MSTLTPFATTTDIVLDHDLSETETRIAEALLDRASVKLRLRVPGVDQMVAADPLRREIARLAVAAAVERVLKNPESAKQITQVAGPFTRTLQVADSLASGLLYFTADDLYGLAPSTTATVPRSLSVRSGYPPFHGGG